MQVQLPAWWSPNHDRRTTHPYAVINVPSSPNSPDPDRGLVQGPAPRSSGTPCVCEVAPTVTPAGAGAGVLRAAADVPGGFASEQRQLCRVRLGPPPPKKGSALFESSEEQGQGPDQMAHPYAIIKVPSSPDSSDPDRGLVQGPAPRSSGTPCVYEVAPTVTPAGAGAGALRAAADVPGGFASERQQLGRVRLAPPPQKKGSARSESPGERGQGPDQTAHRRMPEPRQGGDV